MRTQKTCPCARSRDSSRLCSMHNASSRTTSTTSSVASRKTVRCSHVSHAGSRACPRAFTHSSTHIGTGAVYSFDPVGSYEREACRAAGAAQSLVQPFLDNQVRPPPRCRCHQRARSPTPNDFTLDLFQESDTGPRNQSSHASASPRRTVNRHRLVHECD